MTQSISVVIIDSDPESVNNLVKYITNLGDHAVVEGVANSFENGFELIHKRRPMVVIMDICQGGEADIEKIRTVLERFPQTSVFASCADKSSDTILRAMRAGATEYLLKPVTEMDLGSALQKLGRLWIVKPPHEVETGRVLTLFSPKGGVGVTTIAVNLATNIHELTGKPTVLVDLDLDAGDVTTLLNLKPSYTISDVTANISRLDKSFLKGVITKHESGVFVLAEPHNVEEGVSVPGSDIRKVLDLLKTMFTYIVIDTQSVLDERTVSVIGMSDVLFLTFVLSLPGIRNIQKYLDYFDKSGITQRVRLVVNRYVKRGEIKVEDAEKVLHKRIAWSIPNDYDDAMTSMNKGMPLSMCIPKSPINLSIKDFARTLIGER
jgi:pilus assembly protein CpaE